MKNRALIIGVSNYTAELGSLPAVAADVREVKNILSSGNSRFDAADVTDIVDDLATLDRITKEVRQLFDQAAKDDTIFLYFAGHGVPFMGNYFFLPFDTDKANISDTAYPLSELRDAFEKSKSERVVMWLDFCFSGGIIARGNSGTEEDEADAIARAFQQVQGLGKVIMTACTDEQKAYESPTLGHGRFTSLLIRGLNGEAADQSGEVTINGLHDFIDRNIGTIMQRPMFFGKMIGRIVLMKSRSVASSPAASIQAPSTEKKAIHPVYENFIGEAVKLCMLKHWESWTSWAMSTDPAWQQEWIDNVEEFRRKIIRAVWPGSIPELEHSLQALSCNLALAAEIFGEHCEARENKWLKTIRFYKSMGHNPNYDKDLGEFGRWVQQQVFLIEEATKCANWLAEVVRREIDPTFFAIEGKFVVENGPSLDASFTTLLCEFSQKEKNNEPAASLERMQRYHDDQRAKFDSRFDN